MGLKRLGITPFTVGLVLAALLASLFPVKGRAALVLDAVLYWGIVLLFFLHGASLSRQTVLKGLMNWRLHLVVLAFTYGLFPLLGLSLKPVAHLWLTPELYLGVLFLCALPSTVQSSISFTAIAKGNVSAAVCSASLSNLLGVFLTPLIASLLFSIRGSHGVSLLSIVDITEQLLIPFIVGQILHPWLQEGIASHRRVLSVTDQGVILLIVVGAFSEAMQEGLWARTPLSALGGVLGLSGLFLAIVIGVTSFLSSWLGFSRADRVAIIFCGSKKSLASGLPMAQILFGIQGSGLGAVILPLMVYHQVQLIVCAILAERFKARATAIDLAESAG